MDIRQYLTNKRQQVDDALEALLPQETGSLAEHLKALRYSVFAGGKRVRPVLCIAAAEAVGEFGDNLPQPIVLAACALECIHTYSLIHDDLPAMDDDELRRGKPTNHMIFGEAGAILAGDSLLTYGFELLSRNEMNAIPADVRLRVISLISQAIGPEGMVGGQFLDLAHEGKKSGYEDLRGIHSRKTGALITASIQTGALLGKCSEEQLNSLTEYGKKLGLAFQIVDDLLNVEGTAEQLGKAAGSDAARNKATYPALFGVDQTREKAREAVEGALNALAGFDERAYMLKELAQYILTRKR